jgi:3-methyladenine DNA glycosylase Tag
VFQAGISWRVIDNKWDGIREAFHGFDPAQVADLAQHDVERLLGDPRAVRSKPKIEATIDNAQALIELDQEHRGFRRYLRSHASFQDTVADLKRQFRFIGDSGAYHFLWSVGELTPLTRSGSPIASRARPDVGASAEPRNRTRQARATHDGDPSPPDHQGADRGRVQHDLAGSNFAALELADLGPRPGSSRALCTTPGRAVPFAPTNGMTAGQEPHRQHEPPQTTLGEIVDATLLHDEPNHRPSGTGSIRHRRQAR